MPGTAISKVQVVAAHDGVAEVIVTLRHENGGESLVTLDEVAVDALMKSCAVDDPAALVGQSWKKVRDALSASWNRFATQPLSQT